MTGTAPVILRVDAGIEAARGDMRRDDAQFVVRGIAARVTNATR